MTLSVHQFPCLSDNYGFLLHDSDSNEVACIDTPDADEILKQADDRGLTITQIWNTHWHPDHAGGNLKIKNATGCIIVAPQEVERIAPIDRVVNHDDVVKLGSHRARVIDMGGHTTGHIAYHLAEASIAFVGDSVFALGCGRMFEGTPQQFWASLERIKALPPETTLYCAHEYTEANAKFALHADPDNAALRDYADRVAAMRAKGEATVPTRLGNELDANPFLRADTAEMQSRWGGDAPHETFAALRAAKDAF